MLDRVDARLRAAGLLAVGLGGKGIRQGRELVLQARAALGRGHLGYGVVVAVRPVHEIIG